MYSRDERERWSDVLKERWSDFVDVIYERLLKLWRAGKRSGEWLQDRPALFKAFVVVASIAVSSVFAALFKPLVSPESQFLLYLPAVMVSALYAGVFGGVAATLIGAAATMFLFIFPVRATQGARAEETVALLLYFMAAALILGLSRAQELHKQEIMNFAETLEQRVAERTADLQEANEELESFCYSISHDLRTPMRNIAGSSRMIIDDLGPKLEGEAKANLLSIGASASRLAELVDDLLNHARIGHSTMRLERVDLSELAQSVADELYAMEWERPVRFQIEPKLVVICDLEMLRLALRNLMENACKYSHADRPLLVEIGETRRKGMPAFFVRDNGIGFDMQYVEKIFQPFQRLHRDTEYPGTGIGLANVLRIVERHSGVLWAESEQGVGSTFYFTLGRLKPDAAPVVLPTVE